MKHFLKTLYMLQCVMSICTALFWGRGEDQRKAFEEAKENLGFLEKELEGKKFFGGERFGFVDIVANVIAIWVAAFQEATGKEVLTGEQYPCLFKWAQEYTSCNIILKYTSPPRDRLVSFYKAHVEAADASE